MIKRLWLALLWAFDLVDPKGNPDHGKLAGYTAFWVFVALIWLGREPSLGLAITLIAAAFGPRMFVAFLKSKSVTASEARTVIDQTTRTITERRDHGAAAEPTP